MSCPRIKFNRKTIDVTLDHSVRYASGEIANVDTTVRVYFNHKLDKTLGASYAVQQAENHIKTKVKNFVNFI